MKPKTRRAIQAVFIAGAVAFLAGIMTRPALDGAAVPFAAAPQHLSPAAARDFQTKLVELSSTSRSAKPKPIVITDKEINSYLKYERPANLPPSVKNPVLHFKPEGIFGTADVNFDQIEPPQQAGNTLGAKLLGAIFHGTQPVSALGKIDSSNSTAKLTISDVHIGSTAISDWLVNWLVHSYIQTQYKIDLSKPFLLPDNVTRITLEPGQAIFVRSAKQ